MSWATGGSKQAVFVAAQHIPHMKYMAELCELATSINLSLLPAISTYALEPSMYAVDPEMANGGSPQLHIN